MELARRGAPASGSRKGTGSARVASDAGFDVSNPMRDDPEAQEQPPDEERAASPVETNRTRARPAIAIALSLVAIWVVLITRHTPTDHTCDATDADDEVSSLRSRFVGCCSANCPRAAAAA